MCDAQAPVPDSRLLAAPKAESRKPRAESRKPRAESREPRAGHRRVLVAGFAVACAGLTVHSAGGPAPSFASQRTETRASAPASPSVIAYPHDGDRMTTAVQTTLLQNICVQCHTDQRKPGGVSFEHASMDEIGRNPELA